MKNLYILALALVLVSPLAFVRANEDDTKTENEDRSSWMMFRNSDEDRDTMEERRELMREKTETYREDWKEKREEFRREHAQIFIERIKAHFEWAVKWTQNIHDRMLAKVEAIEENTDKELTDARAHLADAQTHIDEAVDALADIVIPTTDDDASDEKNKEEVDGVRALFADAKTHLQEARESLRLAMQELKDEWSARDGKKSEDSE